MSIFQVTMYSATCDNCQDLFADEHTGYSAFVDKETCRDQMVNYESNGWTEETVKAGNNTVKKFYCPKCYKYDNDDRLMLNTSRRVEPRVYSRDECVFNYCPSPELCKEKNACCNG